MKIILVGLAGVSGLTPLDPSRGSGARLLQAFGLAPGAFLERFTRVNLYPTEEALQAGTGDSETVRNLLPLLSGRRVVALGRRVAEALDLSRLWFEWTHDQGFVGAAMPHPSGLSCWWNDPVNSERANQFMKSLLKPCIHVEGPDGSGKSTLAASLSTQFDLRLVPTDGPPSGWDECLVRIGQRLAPGIICDRSSGLISELVYGPVIRGGFVIEEETIWSVVKSLIHAVTFIICRPPHLDPNIRVGEDLQHAEAVNDNLDALSERYDEVFEQLENLGAKVVEYDRTRSHSLRGVLACAE